MKKLLLVLGSLLIGIVALSGGSEEAPKSSLQQQSTETVPIVQTIKVEEKSAQPQTPVIEVKKGEEKSNSVSTEEKVNTQENSISTSCGSGFYRNSNGNCVHSPSNDPVGATAKCRDGSYSYSQSHRGTCSHHGGVAQWL